LTPYCFQEEVLASKRKHIVSVRARRRLIQMAA
jgi:hypothetical protein